MKDKPLVYIAGPYSLGDTNKNVLDALACAEKVLEKGGLPLVPHLSHYWHEKFPKHIEWWYAYDIELLKRCDYLVRMMGLSTGADNEVLMAIELGIPVMVSSEVWHVDFRFPSKEASIQDKHELAGRGSRYLSTSHYD